MMQQRTFLAATPLDTLRPLAFQGIQAVDCHAQLFTLLEARVSKECALFLAEPLPDPSRATIDWYTAAAGSPRPLRDVPEEQTRVLRKTVSFYASRIAALADELKQAEDSNSRRGGHLLELALSYPSDDCLYALGDQPVLVGWGCGPANAAAVPVPLIRFSAAPPPTPEAPLEAPPTPTMETPPAPLPVRRHPWPWWLLLFLLGFLLCAFLLPWIGPRLGLPAMSFDFLPSGCAPAVPSAAPAAPVPASPLQQNLGDTHDQGSALRAERDRLLSTYAERLAQCPPKEAKVEPVTPETPPSGKLEIPDSAENLTFLEGCWMAGEDMLVNQRTNLPIAVKFCFDKDGKGEALVQEFDAKGKKMRECKGSATATLQPPNILVIDDGGTIVCPNGDRYKPTHATCVNRDNVAICSRQGEEDIPFTRTERE